MIKTLQANTLLSNVAISSGSLSGSRPATLSHIVAADQTAEAEIRADVFSSGKTASGTTDILANRYRYPAGRPAQTVVGSISVMIEAQIRIPKRLSHDGIFRAAGNTLTRQPFSLPNFTAQPLRLQGPGGGGDNNVSPSFGWPYPVTYRR